MNRGDILVCFSASVAGLFLPWQGAQAEGVTLRGYLRTNGSRDLYAFGA